MLYIMICTLYIIDGVASSASGAQRCELHFNAVIIFALPHYISYVVQVVQARAPCTSRIKAT